MKTVMLIVVLCSCVSSIAGQLGGNIAGSLLALGLLGGLSGFGRNGGGGRDFLLIPDRQQTFAQHSPLAYFGQPHWIPGKFCNNTNFVWSI
jgi:hypothetical protein